MPEYTGDLHALIGDAGIAADWCIIAYPQGAIDGDKILVAFGWVLQMRDAGTSEDDLARTSPSPASTRPPPTPPPTTPSR